MIDIYPLESLSPKWQGMLLKVPLLLVMLISLLVGPIQTPPASSGLTVADFQVSPNKVQLGETFTLSGRVVNGGSESAFHVTLGTSFRNISTEDWWYPQEIPDEPRRVPELRPGEVWNFTLTLKAMTVATFDVGVYVMYTKSPEYGAIATKIRSGTVRIEVTRAPPQIPSWLNWWTVVALTVMVAAPLFVLSWRLKLLRRFRAVWKTLAVAVSAMVAIGSIVYVTVLNTRWMPAVILGLPLIEILLGSVSKKALASFLAPVIPTVAVTSAVETLHLLSHYYPPGGVVFPLTALALLTSLMGSGVALRRQGKALGTILLAFGLVTWFFLWLHGLTSG